MGNNLYKRVSIFATTRKKELQKEESGNKINHKQVGMTSLVTFFKHKKLQNMHFAACVCMQS